MSDDRPEIIVAGHICLDVIPTFSTAGSHSQQPFQPGHLYHVGPAIRCTGGAVSNTGRALHRLGNSVQLVGKIGDDLFGQEILRLLREESPHLADGMIRVPGEVTSYTIVINPPGIDRTFLHCPGANDTLCADDVNVESLTGARLFHFGYPPVMQTFYADGGEEMASLLSRVRNAGLTVSLDMCMVDENSPSGKVNWSQYLTKVLPHVDIFCPSVDELLSMLQPDLFQQAMADGGFHADRHITHSLLNQLANTCLEMGAAIVAIKLGDQGLYLRTTSDLMRLQELGAAQPSDVTSWQNRELHAPCYKVEVAGTTGSGDCTIAGLLAAILRGDSPEETIRFAVAVGAASVEAPDSVSGVRSSEEIQKRITAGWAELPSVLTGNR